jgi:uncharacterized repeat protein (TIGR01451 family)
MANVFFSRPKSLTYLGFLLWLAIGEAGARNYLQAHFTWICSPRLSWMSPEPPLVSDSHPIFSPRGNGISYPVDPPTPVVALSVRVPASTALGQELEYRITVENRSQSAAHHVLVRNPLPANARLVQAKPEPSAKDPELIWRLGTLNPGARQEIVLVLIPVGPGDVVNCARVLFEHGQCVTTKIAQPRIQLRKHGPAQAMVNEVLSYQLVITNSGASPLTGIRVTDSLAPGMEHASKHNSLTWEVGNLAAGQSQTIEYQVVAKATGRLCNRAAALADGGIRDVVESCVTVSEAKLTLQMQGPGKQYVNNAASYQLIVSNRGTVPIENVYLINPIPEKSNFVSASNRGQMTANQVQWVLGTLAPGSSRTVDVVLRSNEPGKICNRAIASAGAQYSIEAEFCTEFIGVAALLLEVVDSEDPVEVGAETTYIINIRNQGTAPATNIRIEAIVPDQMEILRVVGPSDNIKDGQKIRCEPLTLQPKGEGRYVVYVKAKEAGEVRFKVNMTADQLTSGLPVHEEESTTIYSSNPNPEK